MPIDPKIVTIFLDVSASGKKRAAHAASLAQQWGAHLIGLHAVFEGVTLPLSMCYARGAQATNAVVAYEHQLDSDAEARAAELGEYFRAVCAGLGVSGEFRPIGRENTTAEAVRIAFHSDLIIVGHPEPHGLPDGLSIERLIVETGAPLLIVPNDWKGETIGSNILIGWNATREARRAVTDAMAFLVTAESVTLLVIDPDEIPRHGEDSGSDITLHLRRHGAHVDFEQVASNGFSVSAILLDYAERSASDLLVVGAYSHARLTEALLGGTTRTLLARTPVPTLMSR